MATLPPANPRFSFGKTVNDMFSSIGRNFLLMAVLAILVSGLPNAIYSTIAIQVMGSAFGGGYLDFASIVGSFGLIYVIGWLIVLLCGVLAQTAVSWVALRGQNEEKPSFGAALSAALSYFFPVLGITLIYYIAVLVIAALPAMAIFGLVGVSFTDGFSNPEQLVSAGLSIFLLMFFVIFPFMLFLVVIWIAAVPAAIQEDLGPIEALRRSWTLTSGHRWKLLVMVFIFFFVLMLVSVAFSMATMPLMTAGISDGGNPFSGMTLATVFQSLLGSLTLIITYPALTATYMNLRIAKEGVIQESVSDIFE